jgi:hypothetical protein
MMFGWLIEHWLWVAFFALLAYQIIDIIFWGGGNGYGK